MTNDRAMELISMREARINGVRAAGWIAAAAAYSKVINAVADRAPVLRPLAEIDACVQSIINDTASALRFEAAAKVAHSSANALAAIADRPCEVARWNIATRGYRLPLP